MKSRWIKLFLTALWALSLSATALAGGKTLIEYKNEVIKPDLAKSVKRISDGKYEFTLKTGITPAMVQKSLGKKLKRFKSTITAKGVNKVIITYAGKEDKFLKKLSKSRIKKGGGAQLAVESSVSDGGIRAKTAARDPKPLEVKGQVISVQGDSIKMIVTKAGAKSGAKNGQILTVKGRGDFTPAKKDIIFFEKVSTKPWKGKAFTKK